MHSPKSRNPFRHLQLALVAITTVTAAFFGSASAEVLLSDNFNTSQWNNTFNNTLAQDQGGTLATVGYTTNTGYDWGAQRGNGGWMLLSGPNGADGLNVWSSLNRNFAAYANARDSSLEIKFNIRVNSGRSEQDWASIAVGSHQNLWVTDSRNKFSSIFRQNGGTHQFSNGWDLGHHFNYSAGDLITLVFSDNAGNGSAFNGKGSVVKIYVNHVLKQTWADLNLGAGDGYISFQAYGAAGWYDNLEIKTSPSKVSFRSYTATSQDDTSWVMDGPGTTSINFGGLDASFGAGDWKGTLANGDQTYANANGYQFLFHQPNVSWGWLVPSVFYPSSPYPSVLESDGSWRTRGLLHDGVYHQAAQLEIRGLTIGRTYTAKLVFADSRASLHGRQVHVSAMNGNPGNSGWLQYAYSDGKYLVVTATWTADRTSMSFDPYCNWDGRQINAVQIRDMDAVSFSTYTASDNEDTSWVMKEPGTASVNFGGNDTSFGSMSWKGTSNNGGATFATVGAYSFFFHQPGIAWGNIATSSFYPIITPSPRLLNDGVWHSAARLDISGLTIGRDYTAKLVFADSRPGSDGLSMNLTAINGSSGTTGYVDYGYTDGQYLVVTANWTATATTMTFDPHTTAGYKLISGIQIRCSDVNFKAYTATGSDDTSWVMTQAGTASMNFGGEDTSFGGVAWEGHFSNGHNSWETYVSTGGYAASFSIPNVTWGYTDYKYPTDPSNSVLHGAVLQGSNAQIDVSGLTIGRKYTARLVFADSHAASSGRTINVSSTDNICSTGDLRYAYPNGEYLVVIANWIAKSTTMTFKPKSSAGHAQINAFQIRSR